MKKTLLFFFALMFSLGAALAQDRVISGKIVSREDGSGLPGVNVLVKGSTQGTVTDADGNFRITVPTNESTLVFSFIGYQTQEIAVGDRSVIDLQLESDVHQLAEVVVTAQGLERDQRSLGYSLQSVNGSAIQQRSEPNVLNSLQGKVAGVNIVGSSGAPGASTNINIRGVTSFNGSNQPLIVVDGIIFSNNTNLTTNSLFDSQTSNRLADINPDNIESINILKGPAASVLYGSRASAGAIVITTKSGKGKEGTQISLSSSYNAQTVYGLPKFQNEFGQGTNNDFVNTQVNSWGPAFDGSLTQVTTLQGDVVPYEAYPNNVVDLFNTGSIFQNTVSVTTGKGDNNMIFSVGNMQQKGIIPNSSFGRTNIQVGANSKLNNGLKIGGNLTYALTTQANAPAGNGGSAMGQLYRIPRSYDMVGRPFEDALGRGIYFSTTQNHPLWSTKYEVQESQVNRVFGNFNLGYDLTKWLSVTYRVTGDIYVDNRQNRQAIGSNRSATGNIIIDQVFRSEYNGDLIFTANKDNVFVEGLTVGGLLGWNMNQRYTYNPQFTSTNLTVPNFYDPSTATTYTYTSAQLIAKQRLLGYYGQASFNYNNYAFVEFTGRVDQSSTLPAGSNTYFYPSVNVSFVPTDAFGLESDILSYLKLKANYAKVGRDATPYQLNDVYVQGTFGNNSAQVNYPLAVNGGNVAGFAPNTRLGAPALTPEFVTSKEVGVNIGLFRNRFGIDFNYFNTVSSNQIFNVAVSNSSGYNTRTTNIGKMTNKGVELVVSATPVKVGEFKWDITANFTRIRNVVNEIAPGVTNAPITGNAFTGITPSIYVGQPYGVVVGAANARNNVDELLVNGTTGLFVPAVPNTVIASPQPHFLAGINNVFTYKNLSLSALVDTRQGGQIYSFSMADLRNTGMMKITGVDRDQPRILPGVIDNGDGTFRPNNIQISSQAYWQGLGGLASEGAVFDATVYRLREVVFSYNLPRTLLSKTPFTDIMIGVSGRNLWFFAPGYPGDPELNTQGAGNIQGFDLSGPPNVRNYGVNLKVTF
ncbi:MAG TPA: SusC/RagA family TonB-linked outer membrane protein [Cyclobacteriaceae bacterium]|nr:SusC/RagA family TonB-linked outer membrane protein [Cyclobacteriaceae bacterium]